MPVYFFHIRNNVSLLEDEEGTDLPDLEAAKSQALRSARDTLCQELRAGYLDLRFRIEVEDANKQVVHILKLADAFKIIPED